MFGHKWFLKIGELTDASILGLNHNAHELTDCFYSFNQGIDTRGQAQTSVRTGDVVMTYDGLPTQDVILWAMTPTRLHNGAIVLCDSNDVPVDKLFFEDGACIGMSINFSNSSKSSIITQLKLQPRKLISGNETLTQGWLNMPSLTGVSKTQASKATAIPFKLAQPIGKISLTLILDNCRYEIERFRMTFSQQVDHKGEPQEETNGGIVEFTIGSMPDQILNRWMLKDTELKNGEFVFEQGEQSSPLKIKFTEAYCINMATRTVQGKGLCTDYVISANETEINGKWLYKNFKL